MSEQDKEKLENKKKACETYIEQTKLLFTLATTFILGPAILELLDKSDSVALFILSELFFILSAFLGYVVLGTLTGSIDNGEYDVYRPATMIFSKGQFISFFFGVLFFLIMIGFSKSEIGDSIKSNKIQECCGCCQHHFCD